MPPTRRTFMRQVGVSLVTLLASGCGLESVVTPPPAPASPTGVRTPTGTPTPKPTMTPVPLMMPPCRQTLDCAQLVNVGAWFDANANGVRDAGEPPLPGVTFRGEGGRGTLRSDSVTDAGGETYVGFIIESVSVPCGTPTVYPSCDRAPGSKLSPVPVVPPGYTLTTPGGLVAGDRIWFGFAPLSTPAPATGR